MEMKKKTKIYRGELVPPQGTCYNERRRPEGQSFGRQSKEGLSHARQQAAGSP